MHETLEAEFILLLDLNQNILHKICKIYTSDADAHKDLFQEMVIQLWRSYPQFKGASKFSTWAYRVCLNTAISLFRVKKRNIQTLQWKESFNQLHGEEYDADQEEKLTFLYAAVRQLNDIEKALVYLYLEEKNYTEIAETLGISEGNARVKMNRIKTKLKLLIKQKGDRSWTN